MPVAPYTWQLDDFLTASRLNAELYRSNGQPYLPNGIGWHAARPVYKAVEATAPSGGTAGTYFAMNSAGSAWVVQADTGAFFGGRGDISASGLFAGRNLPQGGGLTASPAGLAFMWAEQPMTGVAGSVLTALGSGSAQQVGGTMQPMNGINQTGLAFDIMDCSANITGWYAQNSVAGTPLVSGGGDGSGTAGRVNGIWASVYPANGTTIGSLPSVSTYSHSSLTAAGMNGQIPAVMNLLNMPPLLRVQASSSTSCATGVATTLSMGSATYDTYGGWSSGTNTYTVPLAGLYLVGVVAGFNPVSATGSAVNAGVSVNGTRHVGPTLSTTSGMPCAAAKTQIFSLNAGDTLTPNVLQSSGSTINTAGGINNPLMVVLYLGMQGAPGSLPVVPDPTYLWQAGTPVNGIDTLLNAHLANDLQFLTQRPYLLAYQNAAQTGIAMSTVTTLVLQSATGLIHADSGDTYSGWTSGASNLYTAQRSGWYLACTESLFATPTLTSTPNYIAGFRTSPTSSTGFDFMQRTWGRNGSGNGAGALGLYYLRSGDTIQPTCWTAASSSTTTSTTVSTGVNSHFECIWVGA